jgi:hypothetical protein
MGASHTGFGHENVKERALGRPRYGCNIKMGLKGIGRNCVD